MAYLNDTLSWSWVFVKHLSFWFGAFPCIQYNMRLYYTPLLLLVSSLQAIAAYPVQSKVEDEGLSTSPEYSDTPEWRFFRAMSSWYTKSHRQGVCPYNLTYDHESNTYYDVLEPRLHRRKSYHPTTVSGNQNQPMLQPKPKISPSRPPWNKKQKLPRILRKTIRRSA